MLSSIDQVRQVLVRNAEPAGDLAALASDLLTTLESESLHAPVQTALDLKQQGRIDQSIGLITKANRRQLDAIEGLQSAFNAIRGAPDRAVVLAKFRQFQPFEMGIENGDAVLDLLGAFNRADPDGATRRARLGALEAQRRAEAERLAFFESRFTDGSQDDSIAESAALLGSIDEELSRLRHEILDAVLATVAAALDAHPDLPEKDGAILRLSKWLYVLVTSPTATRPADAVRTDPHKQGA